MSNKRIKNGKKTAAPKRKGAKKAKRELYGGKPVNRKRPSPMMSATLFAVGTEQRGNDGNLFVVAQTRMGVKRWVRAPSVPREALAARRYPKPSAPPLSPQMPKPSAPQDKECGELLNKIRLLIYRIRARDQKLKQEGYERKLVREDPEINEWIRQKLAFGDIYRAKDCYRRTG